MNSKQFKQQLLEKLYAQQHKCVACTSNKTNVVLGQGNPDAKLMFVGEAPGREEDEQGKPFVGRSGKLLNRVLELAGLKREDVFITNIVKSRPPNNRTPLPREADSCKNLILVNEVKIIRPRLICTLGSAAAKGLLEDPSLKITRARGKLFAYKGISVLPTYHPAYILRNPQELATLVNDIEKAKYLISQ